MLYKIWISLEEQDESIDHYQDLDMPTELGRFGSKAEAVECFDAMVEQNQQDRQQSGIGGTPAESRYGRDVKPKEPEHGTLVCELPGKVKPEWACSRCGYRNAADNKVCMGAEMGDGRCGKPKPEEPKPLAQYLAEYLATGIDKIHEAGMPMDYTKEGLEWVFKRALDAYQSTENVKIRIEPV